MSETILYGYWRSSATYRTRISEKTGLKTNVEIARYALKQGLVE